MNSFLIFSTKTYIVVLIRSTSLGHFNEYPQEIFLWRKKKQCFLVQKLPYLELGAKCIMLHRSY